jgi:hypothetical protein
LAVLTNVLKFERGRGGRDSVQTDAKGRFTIFRAAAGRFIDKELTAAEARACVPSR